MNEGMKKHFIDELNSLETAMYVADLKEDYWYAAGIQEGIIKTLKGFGYKVVQKLTQIHGDDIILFVDIEEEIII